MRVIPTELDGVLLLQPKVFTDDRGRFVKTFHEKTFHELGLGAAPAEEFFSTSRQHVVRGMHFQTPPMAHTKLVFCPAGAVIDVVLDLRRASRTFGKAISQELNATNGAMLFIPVGCAHGFLALGDDTTMFYQTSTAHSPAHDAGVRWDSFGWSWPVDAPIISARDQRLPRLADFETPF